MDEGVKYADLIARLREIGLMEEPELLAETTQLFLNDAAQMVEAMKAALAKGDVAAMGRAAHRLKGAALNLGAAQVAGPAKVVEDGTRRGEMVDVPASLNAIEGELKNVGDFLKALAKAGVRV